jgi:hypothetical protein
MFLCPAEHVCVFVCVHVTSALLEGHPQCFLALSPFPWLPNTPQTATHKHMLSPQQQEVCVCEGWLGHLPSGTVNNRKRQEAPAPGSKEGPSALDLTSQIITLSPCFIKREVHNFVSHAFQWRDFCVQLGQIYARAETQPASCSGLHSAFYRMTPELRWRHAEHTKISSLSMGPWVRGRREGWNEGEKRHSEVKGTWGTVINTEWHNIRTLCNPVRHQ